MAAPDYTNYSFYNGIRVDFLWCAVKKLLLCFIRFTNKHNCVEILSKHTYVFGCVIIETPFLMQMVWQDVCTANDFSEWLKSNQH